MSETKPSEAAPEAAALALPVFRLRKGAYELIIASESRMAALDAWGAKENLFAQGAAHALVNNAASTALAQTRPGILFRRRLGSRDRFKPVRSA
ncbi:MAG: hypothetical protein ABUS57_07415 [Pseudomonadota bacterium]